MVEVVMVEVMVEVVIVMVGDVHLMYVGYMEYVCVVCDCEVYEYEVCDCEGYEYVTFLRDHTNVFQFLIKAVVVQCNVHFV